MKLDLKKMRKDQWLILFLAGILLIVIVLPAGSKKDTKEQDSVSVSQTEKQDSSLQDTYCAELEKRLETTLSRMAGVGETKVMITLKDQGELVVEKDLTTNSGSTDESDGTGVSRQVTEQSKEEQTVFSRQESSSETPFVTKELQPEIEGIIIVAQGGGSSVVAKNISEAVQALFGLEAHKIKIVKMD